MSQECGRPEMCKAWQFLKYALLGLSFRFGREQLRKPRERQHWRAVVSIRRAMPVGMCARDVLSFVQSHGKLSRLSAGVCSGAREVLLIWWEDFPGPPPPIAARALPPSPFIWRRSQTGSSGETRRHLCPLSVGRIGSAYTSIVDPFGSGLKEKFAQRARFLGAGAGGRSVRRRTEPLGAGTPVERRIGLDAR